MATKTLLAATSIALTLTTLTSVSPANATLDKNLHQTLPTWAQADQHQNQWAHKTLGLGLLNKNITGQGVTVAVIDTGVDTRITDLQPNLKTGYVWKVKNGKHKNTFTLKKAQNNTKMTDTDGHGTHVAGIIAAADNGQGVTGIAPEAKILPINISEAMYNAETFKQFAEALRISINTAIENGATVINISLGGDQLELTANQQTQTKLDKITQQGQNIICKTITEATNKNVAVVVAAGNSAAAGNPISSPAGCEDSITIGSIDPDLTRSYFSNYNNNVDFVMPGSGILSTWPASGLNPQIPALMRLDGTSMATPAASAAIALMQQTHPQLTLTQILNLLTETAKDLGLEGKDNEYGNGLINLVAATGSQPDTIFEPVKTSMFNPTLRKAVNENYQYVLYFNPERTNKVDHYQLTVAQANSGQTSQYTLDGSAVSTPALNPSTWINIIAYYEDGQTSDAGWTQTPAVPPQGSKQGPQKIKTKWINKNKLQVMWKNGKFSAQTDNTGLMVCPDAKTTFEVPMQHCSKLKIVRTPTKNGWHHRTIFVPADVKQYDMAAWVIQGPGLGKIAGLDLLMFGLRQKAAVKADSPLVLTGVYKNSKKLITVNGAVNERWIKKTGTKIGSKVTVNVYRNHKKETTSETYIAGTTYDNNFEHARGYSTQLLLKAKAGKMKNLCVETILQTSKKIWKDKQCSLKQYR